MEGVSVLIRRLLIVDDMPIIVDDLADMFSETEGLELDVHKAYAPDEAIRILSEHKIDIVLSDIKMPGMNGIELLKEIRDRWPRCKVIFLTSYHDFQYAKDAISLGGFDYILKTEGDEMIVQAVRRAVHAIQEEGRLTDLIEKASVQFAQAKPLIQKEALLNAISGRRLSIQERQCQFNDVDMPFDPEQPVYLMISRIDAWKETLNFSNRSLMNFAMQNVLQEYVSGSLETLSFSYDRTNVVWFIQPKTPSLLTDKDWTRLFRFLYGTLETVQFSCRELLGMQVSFIVSAVPAHWDDVRQAFHKLDTLIHRGIGLNRELLATDEELENRASTHGVRFEATADEARLRGLDYVELDELLKSGRKEEFMTRYRELVQRLAGVEHSGTAARLELYHILSALCLTCLSSINQEFDSAHMTADDQTLMNFNPNVAWQSYSDFFTSVFLKWFDYRAKEQKETTHKIITDLQQYIDLHLDGDLSLVRLAEFVHLNPSYLSRLYKQLTGMSLSDYITDVRIRTAKDLLQGHMKIQEIAEAIGYYSGTAFARFFKKHVQMTPQEYREMMK